MSLLAFALLLAEPGTLVLGPADAATVQVRDGSGTVATVAVTPSRASELTLPEGDYTVVAADGDTIGTVRVDAGERRGLALAGQVVPTSAEPRAEAPLIPPEPPSPHRAHDEPEKNKDKGKWKRWGSPLLSAVIPGLGQGINQEPGKALAIFTATVGGSLGAAALWRLRDPAEGAARGDEGASGGAEIARLGSFALITSGLGLLYLGQIYDAHATARGRKAKAKEDHTLGIELSRYTAVGQRPGQPSHALYDDFALSLMGQVARRVTLGAADLGIKLAPETFTLQGGLRAMYRFYDHRVRKDVPSRVWLSAGGGFIFQGSSRGAAGQGRGDRRRRTLVRGRRLRAARRSVVPARSVGDRTRSADQPTAHRTHLRAPRPDPALCHHVRARRVHGGVPVKRLLATLALAGCVIGVRGEAVFVAEHDIPEIDEVMIDLPSTPLTVLGCNPSVRDTCPASIRYDGVWMSTAGTQTDASFNATVPFLELVRDEGFARLRAEVPLSVAGLVELEMGDVHLPGDRDVHLITTLGDIEVAGVTASVTVEVDTGEITIRGGDEGVGVALGQGRVDVETPGHADIRVETGSVALFQTGGAQDIFISTGSGNVTVELNDDMDLDVDISAPGTIRVQTDAINTVTRGSFQRRTGTAAFALTLRTADGDVDVALADQ